MDEQTCFCQQCGNVFRLRGLEKESICPRCGSARITELPSWAPAGLVLSEAPLEWEYECQSCRHVFKLPVPASPSKEKEITCPACGAAHIHRITAAGSAPLYCG
ncbi:MAG TPA: hypothetical protein VJ377_02470 [Dehalococcoidales bacterium]|nr:hypothetical protein [Dehalococcoidales bacterium]